MFRRKHVTIRIILIVLALLVLPRPALATPPYQVGIDLNNVQRATVNIMQMFTNPLGQAVISCVGSGTLVSEDGLILTNAHVALASPNCRSERIVIALTLRIGEAPVARYYAEVVGANVGWDLAVLQITSELDGRPINPAILSLPFVEVGDSETVRLDDTIEVVGYTTPEKDNQSGGIVKSVRGTVSGFTAEARVGDRAWIKTRAPIPGDATGGGAYSVDGKLIGIPTIEPARSEGAIQNCRRIQDSTGDGRIDDQDVCIPVSGLINALRPTRLARGLILAAKLGISAQSISAAQASSAAPAGQPTFSRLLFAPGVDSAGMPTSLVGGMPAGTTRLYLFFDYDNLVDGMIYELRVTRDGVPDPVFSLAPATWSGGRRGLWYVGSTAQVWPNGVYDFTLFIEGTRAASRKLTIGGPARSDPTFTNILFGVPNLNNELVSAGNVLPVGNTINAEFIYNNMTPGLPWRQVWYYEELKVSESAGAWADGANGKKAVSASARANQPLQPGRYRLELWIGEQMAATSDFIMAGGQVAFRTEVFSNLTFASEFRANRPAGTVGLTLPNTITDLYAAFDWRDLAPGTPWSWRWSVNDNLLFEVTESWTGATGGQAGWLRLKPRGRIPDGSYKLELQIAGVIQVSATARVGLGTLPVSVFTAVEGVQLQGQIVDAQTRRGIPGVSIIVLKPEFDVRDFTWKMSEIFAMSLSDSEGSFTLSRLLPRDQFYSLLILAKGYLPVTTDGLEINKQTASPLTLRVELNRD